MSLRIDAKNARKPCQRTVGGPGESSISSLLKQDLMKLFARIWSARMASVLRLTTYVSWSCSKDQRGARCFAGRGLRITHHLPQLPSAFTLHVVQHLADIDGDSILLVQHQLLVSLHGVSRSSSVRALVLSRRVLTARTATVVPKRECRVMPVLVLCAFCLCSTWSNLARLPAEAWSSPSAGKLGTPRRTESTHPVLILR
jgi:hypothetical protein